MSSSSHPVQLSSCPIEQQGGSHWDESPAVQGLRSPGSDSSLGLSVSPRGAVHVAPQLHARAEFWAAWTLGRALGVASGSGITPMGWFRIPNQHLHVWLHGVEQQGKISPRSVTSIFNSYSVSVPCQLYFMEFSLSLDSLLRLGSVHGAGGEGSRAGNQGKYRAEPPEWCQGKPDMELSDSHGGAHCPKGVPNPACPRTLLSSLRTQLKKPTVLLPLFPV